MKLHNYLTIAALAVIATFASLSSASAGSCHPGSYGRGGYGPGYGYGYGYTPYCPPTYYRPIFPHCQQPYYGTPPVVQGQVIESFPRPVVTPEPVVQQPVVQQPVVQQPVVQQPVVQQPVVQQPIVQQPVVQQPVVQQPVVQPAVTPPTVAVPTVPTVSPNAPLPPIEQTSARPGPASPLTAYNVGLGTIGSNVAPEVATRRINVAPAIRMPVIDE